MSNSDFPDFVSNADRLFVSFILHDQQDTCYIIKDKNTLYATSILGSQDEGKVAFVLKPKL